MSNCSIPEFLVRDPVIAERIAERGYCLAGKDIIPTAARRAMENKAFRLTLPDVMRQVDEYLGGKA